MEAFVSAAIDYISAHRGLAGPIAFVFAFAETLAFLSIIIPSTAILVGVGGVVATGALDFTPIWIGASLGSILGSLFSYWLGRRFGPSILKMWPLHKNPEFVEFASRTFAKYGIATVFIGHFVGPLRAVVFLMAGVSRMNFFLFAAVDVVGALVWAWAIPKSGEWGGNILGHIWTALFG